MTFPLQRDIVFVPFPFSDLSTTKIRPVLVVSNNKINKTSDFIALAITSQIKYGPYAIQIDKNDLETGFIPKQSEIRCDKIGTFEKKLIRKRLCTLNKTAFSVVRAKLTEIFV